MIEKSVIVDQKEGIMSINLNQPDALNALSDEMFIELINILKSAQNNKEVRVITLSGAGRAFCSGGDIKQMGKRTPMEDFDRMALASELILTMKNLDQPIIAIVHGYAAGVGASIAMACDQIIASDDSKILFSFSRIGLVADGGGHFFLTRTLGPYRAKEVLFNAEPIEANKALQWGIVNRIFPLEDLHEEAMNYARKLSNGPSRSYSLSKKIVNEALITDLESILDKERLSQSIVRLTSDHKEGVAAFKENREPKFNGE